MTQFQEQMFTVIALIVRMDRLQVQTLMILTGPDEPDDPEYPWWTGAGAGAGALKRTILMISCWPWECESWEACELCEA